VIKLLLVDIIQKQHMIPTYLLIIYSAANFLLNGLNAFWFYKMIRSAYNRSKGGPAPDDRGGIVYISPEKTKKQKKKD
jgi:hypothetical protein